MHNITQCTNKGCGRILPPNITYCAYCGSVIGQRHARSRPSSDAPRHIPSHDSPKSTLARTGEPIIGVKANATINKQVPVIASDTPKHALVLRSSGVALIVLALSVSLLVSALILYTGRNAQPPQATVLTSATLEITETAMPNGDVLSALATQTAVVQTLDAATTRLASANATSTMIAQLNEEAQAQLTHTAAAQQTEVTIRALAGQATQTTEAKINGTSTAEAQAMHTADALATSVAINTEIANEYATSTAIASAQTFSSIRLEASDFSGGWLRPDGDMIYRQLPATWIYGQGTSNHTMSAVFYISDTHIGESTLTIMGMDSEDRPGIHEGKTFIQISINGYQLYKGYNPLPDDFVSNTFLETHDGEGNWGSYSWTIDPGVLAQGANFLAIDNLESSSTQRNPPFFILTNATIEWLGN